jgi:hypothetical protein
MEGGCTLGLSGLGCGLASGSYDTSSSYTAGKSFD